MRLNKEIMLQKCKTNFNLLNVIQQNRQTFILYRILTINDYTFRTKYLSNFMKSARSFVIIVMLVANIKPLTKAIGVYGILYFWIVSICNGFHSLSSLILQFIGKTLPLLSKNSFSGFLKQYPEKGHQASQLTILFIIWHNQFIEKILNSGLLLVNI